MLKKTFWILIIATMTVTVSVPALAEETRQHEASDTVSAQDQEEQQRLLEILEKHTEIATKTHLNADFVPGIVTVLYGDELIARGIRTIAEAMTLVPGMDISLTSDKFGKTVVRGMSKILASGYIKTLLNGTPVTTSFGIDPVPNMPIEQVERIEIIRGPGSAIHGEFAYAGVMNIITRHRGNRIFATLESDDACKEGGIFSWENPEQNFSLSVNLAASRADGANANAAPGTLSISGAPYDNSFMGIPPDADGNGDSHLETGAIPFPDKDGPENAADDDSLSDSDVPMRPVIDESPESADASGGRRDYQSGLLMLNYKDFSFHAHGIENNQKDFYQSSQWGVTATQSVQFAPNFRAKFRLGWHRQQFEPDENYRCPDELVRTYPDARIYEYHYDETLLDGGVELLWKGWDRHTLLLEGFFSHSEIRDVWRKNDAAPLALVIYSEADRYEESPVPETWRQPFESRDRMVSSITLQDEFQVSEQLTLTGGLRYDHYDDIGEKLSPRIAAVYRINKRRGARQRHILKAQYASAFRPPTFLEMYATDDPGKNASDTESETIDTYELGYVYRDMNTVGRITFFYSDIEARTGETGQQLRPFHSKGVELELERALIPDVLKLDSNISYADTEDQETGDAIPEAAKWLANIGLIYQPFRKLSLGLQYRYVGDREGASENDGDTGQYHTADITASLLHMGIRGLVLRGGVKNLFEDDMRYVSRTSWNHYISNDIGNDFSYAEASHPSRWWWIEISYEF